MFAKAAAKQTATTAIKKETLNDAPATKKLENFESENSPGKENRINIEIEVKKEDLKTKEISKNSDESGNLKEKANDSKSVKSSRIDSRKDKKRKRLKKVSTRDKSAPYIPKDMEIYFYAGPTKKEEEKNKALPPVSRTLPNAKEETVKEIQPKAPTFGEAGTYFGESSVPTKPKSR